MNKKLEKYIEKNILPKYNSNKIDKGHRQDHIKYVIRRSLKFAKEIHLPLDDNMIYTIAAYHDIGLSKVDRDIHEKESAKILLNDKELKNYFTEDQIKIMAEAIEDHRASLKREPRSIYGKIVSQADRDTDPVHFIERSYFYTKKHFDVKDEKTLIKEIRRHINEKYGEHGYALNKIWFPDNEFQKFKNTLQNMSDDEIKEIIIKIKNESGVIEW